MSEGQFLKEDKIHETSINTIRTLAMDAVQKANSGHPGAPMGLASPAYLLWTQNMKHNPKIQHGLTGTGLCCQGVTHPCCSTACFILQDTALQ